MYIININLFFLCLTIILFYIFIDLITTYKKILFIIIFSKKDIKMINQE